MTEGAVEQSLLNKRRGDEIRWISAERAVARASKVLRSESTALRLLEEALREGSITVRPKVSLMDFDIEPLPKRPPLTDSHSKTRIVTRNSTTSGISITVDFFTNPGRSCVEEELWRWDLSRFSKVYPQSAILVFLKDQSRPLTPARQRLTYYGVELDLAQLEWLIDQRSSPSVQKERQDRLSPDELKKRKMLSVWEWDELLDPARQLASLGRLEEIITGDRKIKVASFIKRGAQAALERWIVSEFRAKHDAEPGEKTARVKAKELIALNAQHKGLASGEPT